MRLNLSEYGLCAIFWGFEPDKSHIFGYSGFMERKDWFIGRLRVTRYPLHRDKIWGIWFQIDHYDRKKYWEMAFGSHLYYLRFEQK